MRDLEPLRIVVHGFGSLNSWRGLQTTLRELDLILGGGKPPKDLKQEWQDTLAQSLKRQMLSNVWGVIVTRGTKTEWLWLWYHSQWSPLGQTYCTMGWCFKVCLDQKPGERSAFFHSPVWMWEIKYISIYTYTCQWYAVCRIKALWGCEGWHLMFSKRKIVVMRKILIPHERILINCPYTWGTQCLATVLSCAPFTPCFQLSGFQVPLSRKTYSSCPSWGIFLSTFL